MGFGQLGSRRIHKERSQPSYRKKYGFLEKHKDYVKRAKAYHQKEDTIKKLRVKAALRNPDEFYFGMVNKKTEKGLHIETKQANKYSSNQLKEFLGEDVNYYLSENTKEENRIKRLESQLCGKAKGKKTVFVSSTDELKAKYEQIKGKSKEEIDNIGNIGEDMETELSERKLRLKKLDMLIQRLKMRKQLMEKAPKKKVSNFTDVFGDEDQTKLPVYKWKMQRKK